MVRAWFARAQSNPKSISWKKVRMDARICCKRGLMLSVMLLAACGQHDAPSMRSFATHWSVAPSFKYDACNMIGILTGRELYKKYYPELHKNWSWKIPEAVKKAVTEIDRIVGQDWPPGPRLAIFMSAVAADDSLAAIITAMQNDETVYRTFMASDYGSQKNWQQWQELKPHLLTVLQYLHEKGFQSYWWSKLHPELVTKVSGIKQELQAFDVVGDLERFLVDHELEDTIRIHLLSLGQPHELRLTSQTRCTDLKLPLRATVRNFYHEILHPYCDRLVDTLLTQEFTSLAGENFVQQSYQKFGGNGQNGSLKAFLQKDLVIAAELWVAGRRHLVAPQAEAFTANSADAVRNYFRTKDGGSHTLAAVIYSYLESGLKLDRISYADFVKDLFASGRLRSEKIESRYHDFMSAPTASR